MSSGRGVAASGEWTVGWYIPPGHYTHFLDSRVYEGKRHATFAILPMWVTLGYLPFLDVTVRLIHPRPARRTLIPERAAPALIPDAPPPAADIGIYKDGLAAMQFRLLGERRRWPAIGIGIRDFYGFGLFPASYIVMTKTTQIGNDRVRFHGGWGFPWPSGEWGAVEPPGSIPKVHSFVGPFGGADGLVRQNLRAMLEYDTRRVNVGVRWRPRRATPGGHPGTRAPDTPNSLQGCLGSRSSSGV